METMIRKTKPAKRAALAAMLLLALGLLFVCLPQSAFARTVDRTVKTYLGGYTANGGEYDLVEGHIQKFNDDLHYFYSDGYFSDDPTTYNPHLATCGLNLAITTFASTDGTPEGYESQSQTTQDMLTDMGFGNIYVNDWFKQKPTADSIGVCVAHRSISIKENGGRIPSELIVVAIRGGGYESEWASNVTLGTQGEAAGFASAATQTKAAVESYIDSQDLRSAVESGQATFWVVGYSRAGATANLTSKRLIDDYQQYGNQVFGYCYEAPQGGIDAAEKSDADYNWIHNIINYNDLVPMVAPSAMGFKRYGVDHYVPGFYTGYADDFQGYNDSVDHARYDNDRNISMHTRSDNWPIIGPAESGKGVDYIEQKAKMKEQLAILNPGKEFTDDFYLAEMKLVKELGFGETEKIASSGDVTLENYCAMLIEKLQEWSLTSRDVYAGKQMALVETSYTTPENAIKTFMLLLQGSDKTKSDGVMKCLTGLKDTMSRSAMLEAYIQIVRNWDGQPAESKQWIIDELWWHLNNTENEEYLAKYLSDEELSQVKDAFYTLCLFAFPFVNTDNATDADEIFGIEYGEVSSETMVLVGTAVCLGGGLVAPHYEDVNLAWLRSYDSFYEDHPTGPDYLDEYSVFVEYAKDGKYITEELKFKEGDNVTIDSGVLADKRFVKWVEKPHQDSAAVSGLPENFHSDDSSSTAPFSVSFTMPAKSVYLKAYYEDIIYYDNLNIDLQPYEYLRPAPSRDWIDGWQVWQNEGDSVESGKRDIEYSFYRVVSLNVAGEERKLCEYTVPLHSFEKYFKNILKAQNVQVNGAPVVEPSEADDEEDLLHLGEIVYGGGVGANNIFLTIWLPAPTSVCRINQTYFNSMEEAMEAAQSGDTVTMVDDDLEADTENYLDVKPGVTLDLAGHSLKSQTMTVFGKVTDSSETATSLPSGGLLVDQNDCLVIAGRAKVDMSEEGAAASVPAWDTSEKCYRFYTVTGLQTQFKQTEGTDLDFKFRYKPQALGGARAWDKILAEGSGVSINVVAKVEKGEEDGSTDGETEEEVISTFSKMLRYNFTFDDRVLVNAWLNNPLNSWFVLSGTLSDNVVGMTCMPEIRLNDVCIVQSNELSSTQAA